MSACRVTTPYALGCTLLRGLALKPLQRSPHFVPSTRFHTPMPPFECLLSPRYSLPCPTYPSVCLLAPAPAQTQPTLPPVCVCPANLSHRHSPPSHHSCPAPPLLPLTLPFHEWATPKRCTMHSRTCLHVHTSCPGPHPHSLLPTAPTATCCCFHLKIRRPLRPHFFRKCIPALPHGPQPCLLCLAGTDIQSHTTCFEIPRTFPSYPLSKPHHCDDQTQ